MYLFLGQAERLDQVPCKPGFRVKVTEHLEGLISVISDCVQPRLSFSCGFVGLAAFSFKLTVSTYNFVGQEQLYRTLVGSHISVYVPPF